MPFELDPPNFNNPFRKRDKDDSSAPGDTPNKQPWHDTSNNDFPPIDPLRTPLNPDFPVQTPRNREFPFGPGAYPGTPPLNPNWPAPSDWKLPNHPPDYTPLGPRDMPPGPEKGYPVDHIPTPLQVPKPTEKKNKT